MSYASMNIENLLEKMSTVQLIFFFFLLEWESGMEKRWVRSLSQEDPLEEGMATHSSILAWKISRTEEPGGLQAMRSQKVGHDWSDLEHTHLVLSCALLYHPLPWACYAFVVCKGNTIEYKILDFYWNMCTGLTNIFL